MSCCFSHIRVIHIDSITSEMEIIDELDEEYWSRGDPNETTGWYATNDYDFDNVSNNIYNVYNEFPCTIIVRS